MCREPLEITVIRALRERGATVVDSTTEVVVLAEGVDSLLEVEVDSLPVVEVDASVVDRLFAAWPRGGKKK